MSRQPPMPPRPVEMEQLRSWAQTIQGPPPALCLSPECRARLESMPSRPVEASTRATPPRRRRRGLGWLLLGALALVSAAAGWR